MTTNMTEPEQFVGLRGSVEPREDDPFLHEFEAVCIGVRHGYLQVRDADADVYEIEVDQFTPATTEVRHVCQG